MNPVVAFQVRFANSAANGQCAVGCGAVDLAGLAAYGMDAGVKRTVAAASRVQRDRTGNDGRFKQAFGGQQRVDSQGG